MNTELIPFGPGALAFIAVYLLSLLGVGWLGYRARRGNSMQDFYLGGTGIGFVVLVLTLYATQYSGNTLFGFTGKTYKIGFAWTTSIHFMTAIIVFYLLYAPRLHTMAKRNTFITPTDYLDHRFKSPSLNFLATIVMVVAISNYLIGQLKAMGHAIEGLTKLDPIVAYVGGVILLAGIIMIYETLGGFRAVAWTDAIQGLILIIGFAVLLFMVFDRFGSLEEASRRLRSNLVEEDKVLLPKGPGLRMWTSYILLVGIGGALYPQAIQRIYAARSSATLRKSLAVMAFLPLTTTLVALIVGIMAAAHLGDVIPKDASADRVLAVMCSQVQSGSTAGYWLVVVLFSAMLAAIMSTADSVLLSIGSMLTKDIYGRFVNQQASEAQLAQMGHYLSCLVLAIAVGLAIWLRESDLIKLLDRKFDLLIQLAPAFMIGIHWAKMSARATLWGMVVGLAIAVTLPICGFGKIWGFHPGLFGLAANILIVVVGSSLASERERGGLG